MASTTADPAKPLLSALILRALGQLRERWRDIAVVFVITVILMFVLTVIVITLHFLYSLIFRTSATNDGWTLELIGNLFQQSVDWANVLMSTVPLAQTAAVGAATATAATVAVAVSGTQAEEVKAELEQARTEERRWREESERLRHELTLRPSQGPVSDPASALERLSFEAPNVYERLLRLRLHLENFRRRQPTVEEMLDALRAAQLPNPFTPTDQEIPLIRIIAVLIETINASVRVHTERDNGPRHTVVVEAVIATLSMALERDMRVLEERLNELAAKNLKTAEPRDRMKELHFAFHKYSR